VKIATETLATILDVPQRALGTVASVRACAGALYVYSDSDTADRAVLDRSPNYLGSELDVWCWLSKPPVGRIGCASSITGSWPLQDSLDADFERHEFRVPEQYVALVERSEGKTS
jgi:hypothetical protein